MAAMGSNELSNSEDIRPLVRTGFSGNAGLWIFIGFLVVGGFLLFQAMESRRLAIAEPTTSYGGAASGEVIAPLPPLALPNDFARSDGEQLPLAPGAQPLAPPPAPPERVVTRIVQVPAPAQPLYSPAVAVPPLAGPQVAYDATLRSGVPAAAPSSADSERVTATRLKNPSTSVPKGTVIPAVLESALDSTRAGAVRALVTRDVMGFDGTKVLIARGSRLYGEYTADLNYGQNRALVRWTRLLRPDGAMINLDSPVADPLGRAGVKGKVNTHFFARFGAAILQSTLDIGVGLATRRVVGDGVIVALPGSSQTVGQSGGTLGSIATEGMAQVKPTLSVKQGTSVSVFVAKDLDFSTVEN